MVAVHHDHIVLHVGDGDDLFSMIAPRTELHANLDFRDARKLVTGDLHHFLRIQLPVEKGYDTLSGFLLHSLGAIPQQDSEVDLNGVKFKIGKVEGNRILEVAVRK